MADSHDSESAPPEDPGIASPSVGSDTTQGSTLIYPPTDGVHGDVLGESSRAFAQGNYRLARGLARQVDGGSPTVAERRFARQILYRTGIDPVALGVGLACLGLFGLVVWWAA